MLKIAIVEDNNTLRNSLQALFNRTPGMRCVCALPHLMNVVSEISKDQPQVVLMDIDLPNITGIEGVRTIKSVFENIQILMFTVFEDDEKIFAAIRAGASGYLLKKNAASGHRQRGSGIVRGWSAHEPFYCTKGYPGISIHVVLFPGGL